MSKTNNRNNRQATANSKTHPKQTSSVATPPASPAQETTITDEDNNGLQEIIADARAGLSDFVESPERAPQEIIYFAFGLVALVAVVCAVNI
jgi:hypothetical protein